MPLHGGCCRANWRALRNAPQIQTSHGPAHVPCGAPDIGKGAHIAALGPRSGACSARPCPQQTIKRPAAPASYGGWSGPGRPCRLAWPHPFPPPPGRYCVDGAGRHVPRPGPYYRDGVIPLPDGALGPIRGPEPRGSFPASNHVAAALDAEGDRRAQRAVAAWVPNVRPSPRVSVRVWRAAAPEQSSGSGMRGQCQSILQWARNQWLMYPLAATLQNVMRLCPRGICLHCIQGLVIACRLP